MEKLLFLLVVAGSSIVWCQSENQGKLLLVTVATDTNDGLRQYLRSVNKYGLTTKVFGQGEEWRGGDMEGQGGGHKVNILKHELAAYKDEEDLIIMFTDSYDVVLTAGEEEILEKFRKLDARVVFSAEGYCWPDKSLEIYYPDVKVHEKRFLCSGGFIGYAKDIYEIVSYKEVKDTSDDQLYYTNIYLDHSLRERWHMKLDKRSEIFINLHGVLDDVTLKYKGAHSYLYNVKTGTIPIVVHGNGPIKPEFNRIANYLADGWTTSNGCQSCEDNTISLQDMQEDDYPSILMGLFIEKPIPFLREFFEDVAALDYPKSKISIFLHNTIEQQQKEMKPFLKEHGSEYKAVNIINPSEKVKEQTAREWAVEQCIETNSQYFFSLDGDVHLENSNALKLLIQQNRSVLAPLVLRVGKSWSNFWGALSTSGFYARSDDYMDIINREKVGLWNVPYMTGVYLIQGHVLPSIRTGYTSPDLDPDMALCKTLREKGHFMYLSNRDVVGHMLYCDQYSLDHLHNELYEIFNNPTDWEKRYIHADYWKSLDEDTVIEQPCPDVYWFPIVTDTLCEELIEEVEDFGEWSGGKSEDVRLDGGYENVPTDDIHMTQMGLQEHWLEVLRKYTAPLVTRVFTGYYSNPPRAILNFVVKYHPDRQKELRAHHDSSTYTTNIALNDASEYEGGGVRFIRYDCNVTSTRKGWMIMHPGRLTHFHEGLRVTGGTRYIFVSFIDP